MEMNYRAIIEEPTLEDKESNSERMKGCRQKRRPGTLQNDKSGKGGEGNQEVALIRKTSDSEVTEA